MIIDVFHCCNENSASTVRKRHCYKCNVYLGPVYLSILNMIINHI